MSTCPISKDLAQFARAHLSSTTERHIYTVIDGSSEAWSATTATRAAKVSDHEADQALRHFHKAGIVDLDGGPRPRRYRWWAEMAYLREGIEPVGTRDPHARRNRCSSLGRGGWADLFGSARWRAWFAGARTDPRSAWPERDQGTRMHCTVRASNARSPLTPGPTARGRSTRPKGP